MKIETLVNQINHLLEPIEDEINIATEVTENGIYVNIPLLVAMKTTKFSMMIESLKPELKKGGDFSTLSERNQMLMVFKSWFNEYQSKISKMEDYSEQRIFEIMFLENAKNSIEQLFK